MGQNECALHVLVLLYTPVKIARNIAVCFEDVESKSSKRWWSFTFWGDIQRHRAKLARLAVLRAEVDRRIVAMRKEQSEKAGVSTLTKEHGPIFVTRITLIEVTVKWSENWQINFKSSVNDLESLKRVEMLKYGQSLQTQVCDTFSPMNSYNWLPNVPARATWVNWFSVEGGGVCNQMLIPCSIFPFCMRPILIIL